MLAYFGNIDIYDLKNNNNMLKQSCKMGHHQNWFLKAEDVTSLLKVSGWRKELSKTDHNSVRFVIKTKWRSKRRKWGFSFHTKKMF